jgi:hypothetical protein
VLVDKRLGSGCKQTLAVHAWHKQRDHRTSHHLLRLRHASYSASVPVRPPTATLLPSGFQARLVVVYKLSTYTGESMDLKLELCHPWPRLLLISNFLPQEG